jgi:hypothetical protein
MSSDNLLSWSHGKLTQKFQRWGKEIVTAIGLNERREGDLFVLFVTIDDGHLQDFVIVFDGMLDQLANKGILARILTASKLPLVEREIIGIDPA